MVGPPFRRSQSDRGRRTHATSHAGPCVRTDIPHQRCAGWRCDLLSREEAVVIPVLVAYLALLLFAMSARLVVRPRWIDKVAVVALLLLAMLTKPDRAQHLAALHTAATRNDPT